ncbi:MAG: caspase family protein [Planctomycetaceae bacterium]
MATFLISWRTPQIWFILAAMLSQLLVTVEVRAEARRVALVVGNSRYEEAPLKNPSNDADAVSRALQDLGFSVTLKKDLTKAQLEESVDVVTAGLQTGDLCLIFYAGHGQSFENENYLIPIGAKLERPQHVAERCVSVNYLLRALRFSDCSLKVVIVDACRNNPFRSFNRSTLGLTKIEEAPEGTIVSFSTSPQTPALDGDGNNSPFVKHLVQAMQSRAEQLEIVRLFREASQAVKTETGQRPFLDFDASMPDYFLKRRANSTAETQAVIGKSQAPSSAPEMITAIPVPESPFLMKLEPNDNSVFKDFFEMSEEPASPTTPSETTAASRRVILENKGEKKLFYMLTGNSPGSSPVFTLDPGTRKSLAGVRRVYFCSEPRDIAPKSNMVNWDRVSVSDGGDLLIQFDTNFNGDAWQAFKSELSAAGVAEWKIRLAAGEVLNPDSNVFGTQTAAGGVFSEYIVLPNNLPIKDPFQESHRVLIHNRSENWPLYYRDGASEKQLTLPPNQRIALTASFLHSISVYTGKAEGWVDLPGQDESDISIEMSPSGQEWLTKTIRFDEALWQNIQSQQKSPSP